MKKALKATLVLIVLAIYGCSKAPWEDYKAPVPIETEPEEPKPEQPIGDTVIFKIVSIGINNAKADYNKLEALIKEEKADFVVLREVDKNNTRTGITINQAQLVGDLVGMQHVFAPQLDLYREGQFGLAVLSHFPITESLVKKLPIAGTGDQRPFAMIKVEVKEGFEIAFIGVHLDDGSNAANRAKNRPVQASAIVETIKDFQIPTIVAGNFFFLDQADETMPILKEVLVPGCDTCEPTVLQHSLNFVADHIMYTSKGNPELVSYKLGPDIADRKAAIAEIKYILSDH